MNAFAMALVITSGQIDLSVASSIALVSTSMGFAAQPGVDTAGPLPGIHVSRIEFILFVLTGIMFAITAMYLTWYLGSTRPSIAFGFDLEIVNMIVLGGINFLGGSGTNSGTWQASRF